MSIRKITKQQFSKGTTVDGDRLDKALQDTTSYLNAIPSGSSAVRYTQTQVVTGWTALQTIANENQAPWLRFHNGTGDMNGTGTIAHPYRVKAPRPRELLFLGLHLVNKPTGCGQQACTLNHLVL